MCIFFINLLRFECNPFVGEKKSNDAFGKKIGSQNCVRPGSKVFKTPDVPVSMLRENCLQVVCSLAHVRLNPLGRSHIGRHVHHLDPINIVWNSYPVKNLSLISDKSIQCLLKDNYFFTYPM